MIVIRKKLICNIFSTETTEVLVLIIRVGTGSRVLLLNFALLRCKNFVASERARETKTDTKQLARARLNNLIHDICHLVSFISNTGKFHF